MNEQLLCEECGDKLSAGCSADAHHEEAGIHNLFVWGTMKLDHLPPGALTPRPAHPVGMTPCSCKTKNPLRCDLCRKDIRKGDTGVAMSTWITAPHPLAQPDAGYEAWEHDYLQETRRKQTS